MNNMMKSLLFVSLLAAPYAMAATADAALSTNAGKQAFEEHIIVLPVLQLQELVAAFAKSQSSDQPVAQHVGIGRDVPDEQQAIVLNELNWTVHGESKTTRVAVSSPLAAAMRLAVRLDNLPNAVLRFLDGDIVQQEIQADDIAQKPIFWSPMVFAEHIVLEIEIPAADQEVNGVLFISKVSHIPDEETLLAHGIGNSSECQVDLACNSDPVLEKVANAVGKLFFTHEDGVTEACTGTLLNNTGDEAIPYLFTASHCLSSQPLADTLNVVWFFRADQCSGNAASRRQLQTGGAKLLALNSDYDWALFRLNEMPPEGVVYASWSEQPVQRDDIVVSLHHPQGDLLKRNDGKVRRFYDSLAIGSSYIEVVLESGVNEIGSSGAPLLTQTDNGDYLVRGARMFGYSSCTTSGMSDYYIRLDHMIPYVREYLTPQTPYPEDHVMVLEYYHSDYNHYFMTASRPEIHDLDTHKHPGWVRTGLRFFAYNKPVDGAQPVCRYYMRPEFGDSHFYSASDRECREVGERFSQSWIFESANVFYIRLPNTATGTCPQNTQPIWRFFHQPETNHRYTTNITIRDDLRITEGWIPEGYGEDAVIMCTPLPEP